MAIAPFADVARALSAGRGVAIATVVGATGSTPRHLAARMAVADDGEQWGTVGGGRIEERAVAAAREVASGGAPRVVHHHLVHDLAMCCGGAMTIAVTSATTSRAVVERLASLAGPAVLQTPVDGGPLAIRDVTPADAREPRVVGGALVEIVGAVDRAIVFGLGHVGRAVGPLLAELGFSVIACDDDETGAVAAGTPAWAARVVESFDAAEVERELGGFGRGDHVLVVTRDHAVDQRLLEALLPRDELAYLGMIGSRGKVLRFKKRLEARGMLEGDAGQARWARLHAPIGLDLGAETPEEIAVAIAAELVSVRRGRKR
jgi:xanthine dehydrogenase accessory factor